MIYSYEMQILAQQLADMTMDQIKDIREVELAQRQLESERQASLTLDDPLGSVRLYSGFDDMAILVRYQYCEDEGVYWKVFHDYKSKEVEDHQLKRDKLSAPVFTLTTEQLKMLRLREDYNR